MLLEFLRETAFREKFDADVDRELLVSFQVPGVGELGVTSFDPSFWNQLTLLIVLQSVVNLACAFLIYRVILPRPNTATSFLCRLWPGLSYIDRLALLFDQST